MERVRGKFGSCYKCGRIVTWATGPVLCRKCARGK